MHVHNDTGDAVREEANTLHRVAMDAARAEYSAHLAETVHRLDEDNNRRTLELHEQFAESRAFFSAQVSQMRGAISAEVNEAVSQRTAQYSAFAQSLHAETVVMENSEKAVGEQRDSILAENHAMQDTSVRSRFWIRGAVSLMIRVFFQRSVKLHRSITA